MSLASRSNHDIPYCPEGHGRSLSPVIRGRPARTPTWACLAPQHRHPRPSHGPALRTGSVPSTTWLAAHADGIAAVIGDPACLLVIFPRPVADPELAKGLEFDLVVDIDPEDFGTGISGPNRYVA